MAHESKLLTEAELQAIVEREAKTTVRRAQLLLGLVYIDETMFRRLLADLLRYREWCKRLLVMHDHNTLPLGSDVWLLAHEIKLTTSPPDTFAPPTAP